MSRSRQERLHHQVRALLHDEVAARFRPGRGAVPGGGGVPGGGAAGAAAPRTADVDPLSAPRAAAAAVAAACTGAPSAAASICMT